MYLMDPFKELPESALHLYLSMQPLIFKLKPSIAHLLELGKSATFPLQSVESRSKGTALVCCQRPALKK